MAVYPNFPGAFMYDLARDGSVMTLVNAGGSIAYAYTAGDIDSLAAFSTGTKGPTIQDAVNVKYVVTFPTVRQISAINFYAFAGGHVMTIAYSTDTTNGIDGSWSTIGTLTTAGVANAAKLRTQFYTSNVNGVKAVRSMITSGAGGYNCSLQNFCVWGTTQPAGLVMWNPTLDQPLYNNENMLDRGDIYANEAPVVQQFRIKNTGPQAANSVVVQMDTTSTLTTLDTDTTFSMDGSNFAATQTISSIVAGATSPIVYMRRGIPTDPPGTTRTAILRAVAASWG